MTFVSYAQNFEDVLLWRALREVENGFYIDVGAAHPDIDSVTRAFYNRGWSGINVEPVASFARRLREARLRDVTLEVALGAKVGREILYVVEGTGLSTVREDVVNRYGSDVTVEPIEVPVDTLASVCRRYSPKTVHFLKIDVEGSEQVVLAGADFGAFRPWIILVEATAPLSTTEVHAEWEAILHEANYRFVWFDGLNRFYVATEHAESLAPRFTTPPNVFDDFVRVADTEWARRISEAEGRATALCAQLGSAERRLQVALEQRERAVLQLASEAARASNSEARLEMREREHQDLCSQLVNLRQTAGRQAEIVGRQADERRNMITDAELAEAWLVSIRKSTSWTITAPLRFVGRIIKQALRADSDLPMPRSFEHTRYEFLEQNDRPTQSLPIPPERPPTRTIHQFHSGAAPGDAITNAMLLTRGLLRELGYRSEIFVEHRDPALVSELRLLADAPLHDDYVLIVRHSMGHDQLDRILALKARKVLIYHNITPPALLGHSRHLRAYAQLGRRQLTQLRPHMAATLADSEYNTVELRTLGFDPVQACPLLVDVSKLKFEAAVDARSPDAPFTLLFVGRVIESKNQLALVESFALFREAFGQPARLILIGKIAAGEAYLESMFATIRRHGLDGEVVVTGPIDDAERDAWYQRADLYVSLSHHEGFGVPLLEAMGHQLPILAWAAGAVGETLGGAGQLLDELAPTAVAQQILVLARDPARRAAMAAEGLRALTRFTLDRHVPRLLEAVQRAGAAPPPAPAARRALAASMRFAIVGHVTGSYSLAAVNRALATAIEMIRPGTVRHLPVEGEPVTDLTTVPLEQQRAVMALAGRPEPATGPEIVVSQHYPIYLPPHSGDLPVALFFWEESVVPEATVEKLNSNFRAVLAPSNFVAKALTDSGLLLPVRVLGHAPALDAFRSLTPRTVAPDGVTTFLHVSSCFPRKGVDALLAAYARAFRRDDPVRLVIKGFPNPHNNVAAQIDALRVSHPDVAEIRFVNEDLSESRLLNLYREANALVLPTRGEGYNLPAAEALAARLPLIVTGHGGHCDFCGADEARLVDYAFVASRSHLASPGSVSADPDVADLAEAMREHLGSAEDARARARRGAIRINSATEPASLVDRLMEISLDLLLAPPPVPLRVAWISTWNVRCGIAEYSHSLLEKLPTEGIADLVVLPDDRHPEAEPSTDVKWRVRSAWRLGDPTAVETLSSALNQEDPHAIILQHQPGLFHWDRLASLLKQPVFQDRVVLVVLHNTRDLLRTDTENRLAAVRALASTTRIVVHTVADLNLLKGLGLTKNVTMLPHGTAAPPPRPASRALARSEPVLIGSYGFFLPNKGLPQLVEALALLRRCWPAARLRLVNARYDGTASDAEIAACRAAATKAGIEDEVEFVTDFLPHKRSLELLRACDLLVLPYQASLEASSAAVRTALAAGVPSVVTPLPTFEELEDAVLRLDGTDPKTIAAGLSAILADTSARDAVLRAAEDWTGSRSWDVIARRFAGMLRGLCAGTRV